MFYSIGYVWTTSIKAAVPRRDNPLRTLHLRECLEVRGDSTEIAMERTGSFFRERCCILSDRNIGPVAACQPEGIFEAERVDSGRVHIDEIGGRVASLIYADGVLQEIPIHQLQHLQQHDERICSFSEQRDRCKAVKSYLLQQQASGIYKLLLHR
jgi:hypothetical protein